MPKYNLNTTNSNLDVPSPALQNGGWIVDQVLTSGDQNTYLNQANNWTGNYYNINSSSSTSIAIPSPGNVPYQLYQLTSATGCTVTINLAASFPAIDVGQIITIWNNTNTISYFNTNIDATLIPIQPNEWIKLLVASVDPVSGYLKVINDLESLTSFPVGAYKDLFFKNSSLTGLALRGFVPVNPTQTVGNAVSGATYAGNQYFTAFMTFWSNSTTQIVSGGRGISALVDWNANKNITIPGYLGGVLAQYDPSDPNFTQTGSIYGERAHRLTGNENGPHQHNPALGGNFLLGDSSGPSPGSLQGGTDVHKGPLTSISGLGTPHNTIQPTMGVGRMIRLF